MKSTEAEQLGLIHLAVEEGQLDAGIERLLTPILKQPHYALSLAKKAVLAARQGPPDDGMAVESECFSRCFENSFFRDLMCRQLKEGLLTTSEDTSKLLRNLTK